MTLTKKEKLLILILAILVYIFAFVKFVLMTNLTKIQETKVTLKQTKEELDKLESDYQNLEVFKTEIKSKTYVNERLSDYLMDDAGLSDSISFVENLALMIGSELKSISLGAPSEIKEKDTVYYGFPVKFNTVFAYDNFERIIEYCEGSSRKIRVASFDIKPDEQSSEFFNVNMQLIFYSLDKKTADRIYQFSRSTFSQLKTADDLPIFINEDEKLPDIKIITPEKQNQAKTETTQAKADKPETVEISRATADFIFFHRGYLYGGYNFETFSSFNPDERVQKTVTGRMEVTLKITDKSYLFSSVDENGKVYEVSGSVPNRNYTFYLESNVNTKIKENENLYVNIKIQNESGNIIRVKIDQTGDRLKLMDRNGNEIKGESQEEKVFIT